MEYINTYLKFDNSYKTAYLRNNELIDSDDVSLESLFYNITGDVDIILNLLKIPSNKIGYKYWKDAVCIYILNDKNQMSICNEIYPIIARKYEKNPTSIERAMRLCFENALYNISKSEDNFILSFMRDYLLNPRNSEILSRLVELIVSKQFQREKVKFWVKY